MARDEITLDLFRDFEPPEVVARFPAEQVRAETLAGKLSRAVKATLDAFSRPRADVAQAMTDFLGEDCSRTMLDDSIATEGYRIGARPAAEALIDLSQIDFAALQQKFEEGRKATETEKLKGQIEKKLDTMVRENKGRIDFLEKFQKLIESYNSSSHNLEAFFKELMHK